MKVMITGATGFVGSHTAAALLRAGHSVRLLVRSEEKMRTIFGRHGVEIDDFVVGDVTDPASVATALEGCDALIHSAAMVATGDKYADLVWKTNVEGTKNVIGMALDKGIRRIVHVSSITALFDPDRREVDEESPPGEAKNAYGRSKVACEEYVRGLQADGAPIAITYPTGVIGPLDPGLTEPLQGLKTFVSQMAVVTTTGIQFVDVRDVADVHVQLLSRDPKPERFALGGVYYRWYELFERIEALTERKLRKVHITPPVLFGLGRALDRFTQLTGIEVPLTYEAAEYATRWSIASNSRVEREMDFRFRDGSQTLTDTLLWLRDAGHLDSKHVGRLAS